MDRRAIGQRAEDAAAVFLEQQGLTILLRNHRCRMGELDLIATLPPDVLVIAEVRLRSRLDYGGAAASVDARKRSRILRASRHLLATRPALARLRIRFDVIEMQPASGGDYRIGWIKSAFDT